MKKLVPPHRQFGKLRDASAVSAAVNQEVQENALQERSISRKVRAIAIFALVAMLLPGTYVWSRVNGADSDWFPSDLTGVGLMSGLSRQYQAISDQLGYPPGNQPADRPEQGPLDAMTFANNLPTRFADVSSKLAAASGRKRSKDRSADFHRSEKNKSVDRFEPSLTEVLQMSKNAKSQFASVNRMLGVRSAGDNKKSMTASIDSLMEDLTVDWPALDSNERERRITDINAQTATVFREWLPIKTDIPDVVLFAIEPEGTNLRYSYRTNQSHSNSELIEFEEKIGLQVCEQAMSKIILHYGGRYEFVFFDLDQQIIKQFALSTSSCG